jgi:predicted RNA-binding Zn-ribbon protein involved in translation (DUF1610 family)
MKVRTPIKFKRGDGIGRGGPRQGDGGAANCVCPSCGHTIVHQRGTPCNQVNCPECGTAMIGEGAPVATKKSDKKVKKSKK